MSAAENTKRRTVRPWTTDETNAFAALYISGKSLRDCCIIFGRTEQAAIKHMQQAGIVRTVTPKRRRGGRPEKYAMRPLREFFPTTLSDPMTDPKPTGSDDGCLWIRGEPAERMFCGAAREHGSAYCACHHARAYTNAGAKQNTNEGATANG